MNEVPPRVAWKLAVILYGAVWLVLLYIIFFRPFQPLSIALPIFWILLCAALVAPLSTKLSPDGVSQRMLFGNRKLLLWRDVTELQDQGQVLTLVGSACRINIPIVFFSDADAAINYIYDHVPSAVRKT